MKNRRIFKNFKIITGVCLSCFIIIAGSACLRIKNVSHGGRDSSYEHIKNTAVPNGRSGPVRTETIIHSAVRKININSAGREELMKLPGIGRAKADLIIKHRKESGFFKCIEDIKNIPGITSSAFNKIKDLISV